MASLRSIASVALALLTTAGLLGACRDAKSRPSQDGPSGAAALGTMYVRPVGGGLRDGSSWANASSGLPAELSRGAVYWLSAGVYGGYTFDDAASGQAAITLRKATNEDHGTDVGWNAILGRGQAVFGPLQFQGDRYILDGGEPNGLKSVGQLGTQAAIEIAGNHIVLRDVEIDGGFQKSDGEQTAGSCNGSDVRGDYVTIERCEIHNIADDGVGIYGDHVKVLSSSIHDLDGCGTDGGCGPCYNGHSDGLELSGASDIELAGNIVYDVRSNAALFMDDWSGSAVEDLLIYNNVFYTPDSGFAVYLQKLKGAKVHNNAIWGKTQGSRYGGLAIGNGVADLEMSNNIILNVNFSHMGAKYDPRLHRLDYNLFGMINPEEYRANDHDLVGDPLFAGVRMSDDAKAHPRRDVLLKQFVITAGPAIDSGTAVTAIPAIDVLGASRPQGPAWDRGPFEFSGH